MMEEDVRQAYQALIENWNRRDAAGMARLFAPQGHVVGFDGSEMSGPEEIEATLAGIFSHHPTGRYLSLVREVRPLGTDVVLLRAVVGMIPAGQNAINSALNAVQTVIAVRRDGRLQIELFQNTPAAYHGRPEAVAGLTAELASRNPAE